MKVVHTSAGGENYFLSDGYLTLAILKHRLEATVPVASIISALQLRTATRSRAASRNLDWKRRRSARPTALCGVARLRSRGNFFDISQHGFEWSRPRPIAQAKGTCVNIQSTDTPAALIGPAIFGFRSRRDFADRPASGARARPPSRRCPAAWSARMAVHAADKASLSFWTMASAYLGQEQPFHAPASNPARPCSCALASSAGVARARGEDRDPLDRPALDRRQRERKRWAHVVDAPAIRS